MTTHDLLFWVTSALLVQHVDSTIHLQPQILVLGSTSKWLIKWRDYHKTWQIDINTLQHY